MRLVVDAIAARLVALGVRHVFGVGGANIEDLFAAVQRRRPELRVVLCKHEHGAGTAADAYARLRGLGVVMATSGGGAMNLVHSLAEARASSVSVLAIVGEPPTDLQGNGAFQDTSGRAGAVDALPVFRAVSSFAARVERVSELPGLFDEAVGALFGPPPGPAVLLVAKDLQRAETPPDAATFEPRAATNAVLNPSDVPRVLECLDARPVVIVAGPEVARARAGPLLAELAKLLDASVATTPDGRDAFDNRDPRFLGVSGAMGHVAVARALGEAKLVVVVGTRLPVLARMGLEGVFRETPTLSIGRLPPFVSSARRWHVAGELLPALSELVAVLRARDRSTARSVENPRPSVEKAFDESSLCSASILAAVERALPDGSVVLVDAGNTGANAIHYLRAPNRGRWLVAMGMAGMGYAFGAATGAAFATGERCVVLAGDGAFFMHGMEIHTAVEHQLPITYVVFDNRAHGMCLVRERLLLGENAGYNAFRRSRIGAGLAAMFPDLFAVDCSTLEEIERALSKSFARAGPSVIVAELRDVEIPPFSAFQERAASGTRVSREVTDAD